MIGRADNTYYGYYSAALSTVANFPSVGIGGTIYTSRNALLTAPTAGRLEVHTNLATIGSVTATNGVALPGTITPPAIGGFGAHLWSDGTNLCVVLQNAGGTKVTNKVTMTAWP